MRIALGLMLGVPPAALQFSYGDKGKPHLAYPDPQFDFNLSHTGELALLAVSRAGRIGVDIEKVDKRIEHTEIATAFFSPAERMALSEFEPADRAAAFFRCWTRKEAIIKALGDGLSLPLDQFDVTLSDELRLLSLFSDTNPRHWSLFDLRPEPEMAAAVAVEGTVKSLQTLSWDPVAALPLWA